MIWGMCPTGEHGLDYPNQPCDLCEARIRTNVSASIEEQQSEFEARMNAHACEWTTEEYPGPDTRQCVYCQTTEFEARIRKNERNKTLEEAALKLEALGGDFYTCAPAIRALKDSEDGT